MKTTKKTDTRTKAKLSKDDYINALVRSPEFEKDKAKYQELLKKNKDAAQLFLYKIFSKWNCKEYLPVSLINIRRAYFHTSSAFMIPVETKTKHSNFEEKLQTQYKTPDKTSDKIHGLSYMALFPILDFTGNAQENGNFIYLKVDITAPKEDLNKYFKKIIDTIRLFYQGDIPRLQIHPQNTINIWFAHDKVEANFKQFKKHRYRDITRNFFEKEYVRKLDKNNLKEWERLRSDEEKLKESYKKACRFIHQVEEEAKERENIENGFDFDKRIESLLEQASIESKHYYGKEAEAILKKANRKSKRNKKIS